MVGSEATSSGKPAKKRRHWLLTAYLALTLLANLGIILLYTSKRHLIANSNGGLPPWSLPMLCVLSVFNIVCTVALLKWWKWGFWGLTVSALVILGINLFSGLALSHSIWGLLGPILMFGLLNIGTTNKAWPQLR